MALDVTINGVGTTYALQANNARITYTKSPIVIPIPGGLPQIKDLGQFTCRIIIEGTLGETAGTDGGNIIPSKENLEDIAMPAGGWYDAVITTTISGDVYLCEVASLNFELVSAREEYWSYILILETSGRV